MERLACGRPPSTEADGSWGRSSILEASSALFDAPGDPPPPAVDEEQLFFAVVGQLQPAGHLDEVVGASMGWLSRTSIPSLGSAAG